MTLTAQDRQEIAEIREQIDAQLRVRNKASSEIQGCNARLRFYQLRCDHPQGYQTSCMGDLGFYCPECGYSR